MVLTYQDHYCRSEGGRDDSFERCRLLCAGGNMFSLCQAKWVWGHVERVWKTASRSATTGLISKIHLIDFPLCFLVKWISRHASYESCGEVKWELFGWWICDRWACEHMQHRNTTSCFITVSITFFKSMLENRLDTLTLVDSGWFFFPRLTQLTLCWSIKGSGI